MEEGHPKSEKATAFLIMILILFVAVLVFPKESKVPVNESVVQLTEKTSMKLTSTAFSEGGTIPAQYTCDGANKHPPLTFEAVPPEAKSLVLIMDDPDVPRDRIPEGVFDHWIVFNIEPKTTGVAEDAELHGTFGNNSRDQAAYTGPCPPDKEHRYFFRLYALDTQLALKKGATKKEVLEAIESHVLAKAELMGRYNRPQNQ